MSLTCSLVPCAIFLSPETPRTQAALKLVLCAFRGSCSLASFTVVAVKSSFGPEASIASYAVVQAA